MKLKKILYTVIGCVGVGLSALGTVIPVLPTFPFMLLALFCFARSSERLHRWFVSTKLYKNNLESYVKGKGMTRKAKTRVILAVTAVMGAAFALLAYLSLWTGCIILACVWVLHIIYFALGVKNLE